MMSGRLVYAQTHEAIFRVAMTKEGKEVNYFFSSISVASD